MRHNESGHPLLVVCYALVVVVFFIGLLFIGCQHDPHCRGGAALGWYFWASMLPLTLCGLKFQGTI